jgi:two-component system copper resistance phosphate regulon response regulator CusR
MMKVLLVDDDKNVANFITKGLNAEGFEVEVAYDGKRGQQLALEGGFSVILLDIMLPVPDGMEILRAIRRNNLKTPVMMLTAKDSVGDRVKGLNEGADDYLVKPFAFTELVARINALLRRGVVKEPDTVLEVGDLKMDLMRHQVHRGDKKIDLTTKEFVLLEYLLRHKNQPVTRAMIAENVWNENLNVFTNAIDVYVRYLRNKVDKDFGAILIHTVRGVGYMISADPS